MTNTAEFKPTTNVSGENPAPEPTVTFEGVPIREISLNIAYLSPQEQEQLAELRRRADERQAQELDGALPLLERAGVDLIQGAYAAGSTTSRRELVDRFVKTTEMHAGSLTPAERATMISKLLTRVQKIARVGVSDVVLNALEFRTSELRDAQAELAKERLESAKFKIDTADFVSTARGSIDELRANYLQGDVDTLEVVDAAEKNLNAALTPRLRLKENDVMQLHVTTAELEQMIENVTDETVSPPRGTEIAAIRQSLAGRALSTVRNLIHV
ncbi:MAG: hypothetical protein WAQ27_06425 [Candidatus Microsaccharimonas sp.]